MIRALPLCLLLAACADFPDVGRAETDLEASGETPALLTAHELAALTTAAPDLSNALAGDVAGLRERARRLRQR